MTTVKFTFLRSFRETALQQRVAFLDWLNAMEPGLGIQFAGNVDAAIYRNGKITINNHGGISYTDRLRLIGLLKRYYFELEHEQQQ